MKSIWKDTAALPSFPSLKGDHTTDVLIIGGGITGILCAHFLKQRGVPYLLAEAGRICQWTTGNTTAKITSQHGLVYHKIERGMGLEKARLYLEANENALARYKDLARAIPCDFEEKDNYVYSPNAPKKLERELKTLEKLHFPASLCQNIPIPVTCVGAVRYPRQAQFHPLKFLASIASGLPIYENTKITAVSGRTACYERGTIKADQIIVATHYPFLDRHGLYFLKLYQNRSYVTALSPAPDYDGMYVSDAAGGYSFRNYKNFLLLGGGAHRTGKKGGGFGKLRNFSKKHYPQAEELYAWAAQDCMPLDSVPYIGAYSKNTDGIYAASGFQKWGMTAAMAAAMLLADLVTGRKNPYESLFLPSRSIAKPQLFKNAAESAIGLLTPTMPRCPHLGCALKWNPEERSWDCPCHGSRFSKNGRLLNNPANKRLPRP